MTMATISSLTDRTDRVFEIHVQAGSGQRMGRTSNSKIKVSYSTLAQTISAIGRRGAKVLSVTMLASPSTKVAPIAEAESVVELEPIAEAEPIVEAKQVVELEPIAEAEPIVEAKQFVELEPIAEAEPIVEAKQIVELEPIVEVKTAQTTTKAAATKQTTRRQQSSKSKKR